MTKYYGVKVPIEGRYIFVTDRDGNAILYVTEADAQKAAEIWEGAAIVQPVNDYGDDE